MYVNYLLLNQITSQIIKKSGMQKNMVSHVLLLILIKKNPIVEKLISKVVSLHLEEKGSYELK